MFYGSCFILTATKKDCTRQQGEEKNKTAKIIRCVCEGRKIEADRNEAENETCFVIGFLLRLFRVSARPVSNTDSGKEKHKETKDDTHTSNGIGSANSTKQHYANQQQQQQQHQPAAEMSGVNLSRNEVVQFVLRISLLSIVTYYSAKWLIRNLDPSNKSKKKAIEHAEEILRKLSPTMKKSALQNLNEYEMVIASHLVVPENITESWDSIAGLDDVCQEIKESLVFPVCHRDMFAGSALYQPPKGVLLYGPPGCGKTLIAKATAKEAGMRFINLDVAMLTDKWYGESQKLASAVFTLAVKIQPCIIFIDEIDSFLRARNSSDHEATAMMKTQFMMLWDGLNTESDSTIIVMGATNRPQDLDKAILRRMPAQFHIGLPNEEQRHKILQLILANEKVAPEVDYLQLARKTNGYSGSDLKEVCRNASVHRIRKVMKNKEIMSAVRAAANSKAQANGTAAGGSQLPNGFNGVTAQNGGLELGTPAITMEDLEESLRSMRHSKYTTGVLNDARIDLD